MSGGRPRRRRQRSQADRPCAGKTTAYQGNVSASLVRVGELFRDAVRLDASGVILVHNHPSGDPTPSPDDLMDAAASMAPPGLRLLDAIHLATAEQFGATLGSFVTYDERLAATASARGHRVAQPR